MRTARPGGVSSFPKWELLLGSFWWEDAETGTLLHKAGVCGSAVRFGGSLLAKVGCLAPGNTTHCGSFDRGACRIDIADCIGPRAFPTSAV